jgi:hypothetical protein
VGTFGLKANKREGSDGSVFRGDQLMNKRQVASVIGLFAMIATIPAAQADGWGSLGTSYRAALPGGGMVSEGVGLSTTRGGGNGVGQIALDGIPDGAMIDQAFLYWQTYGGADFSAQLDGHDVVGSWIGRDGDTCWQQGDASNNTFRADVTSLVGGDGIYSVSGIGGNGVDAQGASLVVVYLQPDVPSVSEVILVDGSLSSNNQIFTNMNVNIPLGLSHNALSAEVHVGFGDGHPHFVNGQDNGGGEGALLLDGQQILAENQIKGSDGPFWDDYTLAAPTSSLTAGDPSANLRINNGLDCFTFVFAALVVGQPDTIGPIVRGTLDPRPNASGWNNTAVTVNWQAFDGNGATQPPPTMVDGEGLGITAQSAPSCDNLNNCSTGSVSVNIDKTGPDTEVRPFEFPIIGEMPDQVTVRLFDNWVGGRVNDSLSGIQTVSIVSRDITGEVIAEISPEWINCDFNRNSCEFGAELPSEAVQRVTVSGIDRAGNLDPTPVTLTVIQPPLAPEECPLGPLCGD